MPISSLMRLRLASSLALCLLAFAGCRDDSHSQGSERNDVDGVDAGDPADDTDAMAAGDPQPSSLNLTTATNFGAAFRFLFEGPGAVQTGVAPEAIENHRLAVLRGKVVDQGGAPVPGVLVTIVGVPTLGSTRTRTNGGFDLAVNGGGRLRVAFAGHGYLPVERELSPTWNSFETLEEITLTRIDPMVSEIRLGANAGPQIAMGSRVSDRSGDRTGTLIFPANTTATMKLPNGTEAPLTTAHVHVTEYTAGDRGPRAMPASLPPQSGYTYAVELSIEEAEAEGAQGVEFSRPVPYYVENFLGFPTGEPVPAGFFDRKIGEWVPSNSGRIVRIVDIVDAHATLDVDGDQVADSSDALSLLGIDQDELAVLASRYAKGTSLWRIPLPHFSAWDFNWCFLGGLANNGVPPFDGLPLPDDCKTRGSVIECENQILGESVKLNGVPYDLYYRSDRVAGRKEAFHFELPLTGDVPPGNSKRVRLELEILGQHITHVADALPNQRFEFDWDGRDGYGRIWQGAAPIRYRVGYVYDGWYTHTPVFGTSGAIDRTRWDPAPNNQQPRPAGFTAEDDLARLETTMWSSWQSATLGTYQAAAQGMGGLTIEVQHLYDANSRTLYLGNGERRQATSADYGVEVVLGAESEEADGRDAQHTAIEAPHGIAVAPDGSAYVSLEKQHRIVKIDRAGVVTPVAGTGSAGFTGEGGQAAMARLDQPLGIALGADGTLYFSERGNRVVRRILPNGTIEVFAGGAPDGSDDGSPRAAKEASFGEPHAVALAADGSLYIADSVRHNVRRVRTDGVIEMVAGSPQGEAGDVGDGGPAVKALLRTPLSVAVGPDGRVYIAEGDGHRVRGITPDGAIATVAGTGVAGYAGDGEQAPTALLNQPHTVDVATDGSLFISDEGNRVIRKVAPDGTIRTYAGGGELGARQSLPALDARFSVPRIAAVEPQGGLLVADYDANFVYRIFPLLPAASSQGALIASQDGRSYFEFDADGRHLRTVDAETGWPLWSFSYDPNGNLLAVNDAHGRALTVERDATTRRVQKFVSPDGLASSLRHDDHGWLSEITRADGRMLHFSFSEDGLLRSETDAAGNLHSFEYDATGRLTKDVEASGAYQELSRSEDDKLLTRKSASGLVTTLSRKPSGAANAKTLTLPDGRKQTRTRSGVVTVDVRADGTLLTSKLSGDPRFGMQAPFQSRGSVTLPSGLTYRFERTRTATLKDPHDPSSVLSTEETTTVADGPSVVRAYDASQRRLTTKIYGDTTTTIYDEKARVSELRPAGGLAAVHFTYDQNGRVVAVTQGSRTVKYGYDGNGHIASMTDPLGVVHEYESDALGRILSMSSGGQQVFSSQYDEADSLQSLLAPNGKAHTFEHDESGHLTSYTAPEVNASQPRTTQFGYNADDEQQAFTAPSGSQQKTERDEAGRLTAIDRPEGKLVLEYDDNHSELTRASLGSEALALSWDGPLPTAMSWSGTVQGTLRLTYDKAFRVRQYDVGGGARTYSYDDLGRLKAAGAETLLYRDSKRITRRALQAVVEEFEYSADYGELTSQDVSIGSRTPYQSTLTYDALGRIESQTEIVEGERSTTHYTYDPRGRLVSVKTGDTAAETFTYDANGNRLNRGATYDAQDRLTRSGSAAYEYDADGNLARRTDGGNATTFQYDSIGQLRHVATANRTIEYVIDPLGHRIGKKVNGTLVLGFLYDLKGRVIAELDGHGKTVSEFVYAAQANVPDYMLRDGSVFQIVSDSRGSPRLIIDASTGEITQRLDYDVWGVLLSDTNEGFQPFGFAGGLWDADVGLVRFGARDYDPQIGRWTAKDQRLFGGGTTNLYEYARNDPVNFVDPTGFAPIFEGGGGSFGGGGASGSWDPEGPDAGNSSTGTDGGFWGAIGSIVDTFCDLTDDGYGDLSRAKEFGVKPYKDLKKETAGTGLQAHHLIEQRFASVLGTNPNNWLSVAVTPAEHQKFTNAWRQAIPYGANGTGKATKQQIEAAARTIYADYPEILKALGL